MKNVPDVVAVDKLAPEDDWDEVGGEEFDFEVVFVNELPPEEVVDGEELD